MFWLRTIGKVVCQFIFANKITPPWKTEQDITPQAWENKLSKKFFDRRDIK